MTFSGTDRKQLHLWSP